MEEKIIDTEIVGEATEEMVYMKDLVIGSSAYTVETVQVDGKEYVLKAAIGPMIEKELKPISEQFERLKEGLNTQKDEIIRYKKMIDLLLGE